MVPFIDIVLVLLIIFMITAPILQSSIEVDVPKTKTTREINEQKIVVTMDKNQLVYLGNDPVKMFEIGPKITAKMKKPNEGIFLRCDKTVPFGAFASLMDSLRQVRHHQHQHRHRAAARQSERLSLIPVLTRGA